MNPMDELFDFFDDIMGESRYTIKGKNGEVMVTSEGYSSMENAQRGSRDLVVRILRAFADAIESVEP